MIQTLTIFIFVSFSMPTSSLEAILRDAKTVQATVVLRGLVEHSFQRTAQRVGELVKASGGEGMVLHPGWFKQFHIQTVPAVVVTIGEGAGAPFDVITGDIPLRASLRAISQHSQLNAHRVALEAAWHRLEGRSDA